MVTHTAKKANIDTVMMKTAFQKIIQNSIFPPNVSLVVPEKVSMRKVSGYCGEHTFFYFVETL